MICLLDIELVKLQNFNKTKIYLVIAQTILNK